MRRLQVIIGQQMAAWFVIPWRQVASSDGRAVVSPIPLLAIDSSRSLAVELLPLLILAGAVWMGWKLLNPRPTIKIQIQDGTVTMVAGKVRPQFLRELGDVIAKANLQHGTMTAPGKQSGRVIFRFSHEFSPELQQQIRNTWYANS